MFYLVIQTALLVLAAFVLGAIVGCLLKRFVTAGPVYGTVGSVPSRPVPASEEPAPKPAARQRKPRPAESAAAAAAATVAARTAHLDKPEDAPAVRDPVTLPEPPEALQTDNAAMSDAAMEAALAALPADPSNEDKANAVGTRPPALAAPEGGAKDNLQRIKGIGKVNEGKLNDLGIYHFAQIAGWTPAEVRWVATYLVFSGRIEREDWIGQAKVLAEGGETAFARRVDAGKVDTSSSKK